MNRAEKFIKEYTRNCSNELDGIYVEGEVYYSPWITPDQARRAVEIAREEIYKWLEENVHLYIEPAETIFGKIKVFNTNKLINDLKQAMKDE